MVARQQFLPDLDAVEDGRHQLGPRVADRRRAGVAQVGHALTGREAMQQLLRRLAALRPN